MRQKRDVKAQRLKILYQRWAAKLGLSILATNAFFPKEKMGFFLIFYKLLILENSDLQSYCTGIVQRIPDTVCPVLSLFTSYISIVHMTLLINRY